MAEPITTQSKPTIGQRRYNVVLTGHVRKGFTPEQVSVELARLASINAAQATLLLSGSPRVVKTNIDQNTATQFQTRFEAIGAQCAIRPVATGPPVDRMTSTVNTAAQTLTPRTIKEAFSGDIPSISLTMKYRVALVAVAALMILLPIIYATFVIGVASATVWHALNDWDWFIPSRRWGVPFLFLYAALCVVGGVLTVFMIKPFFAPAVKSDRPLKLSHQDDPLFFAFVDLIAQRVGAPMPVEIHVDCTANASAGAQHGLIGLYSGCLVLTVGLPLIGGLTARQLAGVIAHELGHFAQRSGMTFWYIVNSVNTWLSRMVYDGDAWDAKLDEWVERYNDSRGLVLLMAKGAIWLTRKCLLVFHKLGVLVSRSLERQMEFDADRYEACIAGSSMFRDTTLRIKELNAASDAVGKRLSYSWDDGKLSDNFPKMIIEQSRNLPDRYREAITQGLKEQRADYWSTHPTDYERIANADALGARGIFWVDVPGNALLARYERLCRQASLMHYRYVFNVAVKAEQLVSSAEVNSHAQQRESDAELLKRYLAGQFWPTRYLNIKRQVAYAAPDHDETKRRLDNLVQQIRKGIPDYEKLLSQYKAAYDLRVHAFAARLLAQHGVAFDAAAFKLRGTTENDAAEALQSAAETTATLEPELVKFEAVIAQRLALALAMRADAQTQDDTNRLLQALAGVAKAHEVVINLRCYFVALDCGQQLHTEPGTVPALDWHDYAKYSQQEYAKLLALVGAAPYPFERKDGVQTVADYLRSYCGTPEQFLVDETQLLRRVENVWTCVEFLHERVMARLAAIAKEIEEKLGVEPIKQSKSSAAKAPLDPDDIPLPF